MTGCTLIVCPGLLKVLAGQRLGEGTGAMLSISPLYHRPRSLSHTHLSVPAYAVASASPKLHMPLPQMLCGQRWEIYLTSAPQ